MMMSSLNNLCMIIFMITFMFTVLIFISSFIIDSSFVENKEPGMVLKMLGLQGLGIMSLLLVENSSIIMVLLEGFNVVLFFLVYSSVEDSGHVYLILMPTLALVLLFISVDYGMGGDLGKAMACSTILMLLMVKYGLICCLLVGEVQFYKMEGGCSKGSFNTLFYIIGSKFMTLFYAGVLYSKFPNMSMIFMSLFKGQVYFSMGVCLMMLTMTMVCVYLLSKSDIEGYMLGSLCSAHVLLVLVSFLSLNLYLTCFLWDVMLSLGFLFLMYTSGNLLNSVGFDSVGQAFFFLLLCYGVGVPPFPSYYLDMCFYSMLYMGFGSSGVGMFFMLLVYLTQVGLMVVAFHNLASSEYYNLWSWYSEFKLGFMIMLMILFMLLWMSLEVGLLL